MKFQNWDTLTREQKQFAVNEELRLVTHNGTTREDLLNCLRFQADECDTLKKALGLALTNACGEAHTNSEWDLIGCPPDVKPNSCQGGNKGECHNCWVKYYIQQAKEKETFKLKTDEIDTITAAFKSYISANMFDQSRVDEIFDYYLKLEGNK